MREAPGVIVFRSGLERDLSPESDRVEFCAGVARVRRADLPRNVSVEIVQHETEVLSDVPVETGRVHCLSTSSDSCGTRKLIVEIDPTDTSGDFPGAPPSSGEAERVGRRDAAIGSATRKVG